MSERISTKELFDSYSKSEKPSPNLMKMINNDFAYEYEQRLEKQLVDMTPDEICAFIVEYRTKLLNEGKTLYTNMYSSFGAMIALYRKIFDYYIMNYEIIRNPMVGVSVDHVFELFMQGNEPYSRKDIDMAIQKIYSSDLDEMKKRHLELIFGLAYDGVSTPQEVMLFREEDINHKKRTVRLPGKVVQLTERTYSLLVDLHQIEEIEGNYHFSTIMASWRGSYFKLRIRESTQDSFDKKSLETVAAKIVYDINRYAKTAVDGKISFNLAYMCGFFDNLVNKYGIENITNMVKSLRDANAIEILSREATLYGVPFDNITQLKNKLRIFVK